MDDTLRRIEQFRQMVKKANRVFVQCILDPDDVYEIQVTKKAILEVIKDPKEVHSFMDDNDYEEGTLIVAMLI